MSFQHISTNLYSQFVFRFDSLFLYIYFPIKVNVQDLVERDSSYVKCLFSISIHISFFIYLCLTLNLSFLSFPFFPFYFQHLGKCLHILFLRLLPYILCSRYIAILFLENNFVFVAITYIRIL